jgi:hypothetical protein
MVREEPEQGGGLVPLAVGADHIPERKYTGFHMEGRENPVVYLHDSTGAEGTAACSASILTQFHISYTL